MLALYQELIEKGFHPELIFKPNNGTQFLYIENINDHNVRVSVKGSVGIPSVVLAEQNQTLKTVSGGVRVHLSEGESIPVVTPTELNLDIQYTPSTLSEMQTLSPLMGRDISTWLNPFDGSVTSQYSGVGTSVVEFKYLNIPKNNSSGTGTDKFMIDGFSITKSLLDQMLSNLSTLPASTPVGTLVQNGVSTPLTLDILIGIRNSGIQTADRYYTINEINIGNGDTAHHFSLSIDYSYNSVHYIGSLSATTSVTFAEPTTSPIITRFTTTTIDPNSAPWEVVINGITSSTPVTITFSGSASGSGSITRSVSSTGILTDTIDLLSWFTNPILGETITITATYTDSNDIVQSATNTASTLTDPLEFKITGSGSFYVRIENTGLTGLTSATQIAVDKGDGSALSCSVFHNGTNNRLITIPMTQSAQTVKIYSTNKTGQIQTFIRDNTSGNPQTLTAFLTEVVEFGENFAGYNFMWSPQLTKVPATFPSTVTNMYQMFHYCPELNDPNISNWDVSNVTNFDWVFKQSSKFNQPLNWNTSNGTRFEQVFESCTAFNQPLTGWDVSKGTTFQWMFSSATSFNQDISYFAPMSATNMDYMFDGAASFDQDLSQWCVPLISAEPSDFSTNSPMTTQHKPVWGTCPRGENVS